MAEGADRLHGLSAFAETVSTCASVPELLASTAQAALAVVGADAVSIGRFERARSQIRIVHNAGTLASWEQAWPLDETYLLSQHPQAMATLSGGASWATISADDVAANPADRELLRSQGKQHAVSFQVTAADDVWGDLYLARTEDRPFDENDVAAGVTLTGLLAAGLSRLELVTEMSRLAYTDPLTGVANRRAADDWLDARLTAAEPFPPVSVVLCDINGLKAVNDAFGHAAGDELIKLLGTQLVTAAGDFTDTMVARIGGDEFLVLLDGVAPDGVQRVVGRLAAVELPHGSSVAVGAATTTRRPAGAENTKTAVRALMRLADAAQYRHKQTRRLSTDALTGQELPISVLLPAGHADLTDLVLRGLRDDPDRSVEHRLALVTQSVATAFEAASWWVSREDDEALTDVLGAMLRRERQRLVHLDLVTGQEFDVGGYPASDNALGGGGYYASLTEGDPAERALIARMGYVAALGAGEVDASGTRWLVEVFADDTTSSGLFVGLPLLRALVHLAVTGAQVP